jgi:ribosomal protein L11 methyltransferase
MPVLSTASIEGNAPTTAAAFTLRAGPAKLAMEALGECLDPTETAVTLSETAPDLWTIRIYFAAPPDAPAIRALVAATAGSDAAASLSFQAVAAQDWVATSLAGLAPVLAGRFVVHGSHDRGRVPRRQIAIEVEAALAFGTGHHGTTRGCLLALDEVLKARTPRRILDVGTGTGVLAIAAAKALRQKAIAGDIDATAVRVARANASANGVGAYIRPIRADGLSARAVLRQAPYSLVFANILLGPLVRLAAPLARVTSPGSLVILSGLLPSQAAAAIAAYRTSGFRLVRRREIDGWITMTLSRAAGP